MFFLIGHLGNSGLSEFSDAVLLLKPAATSMMVDFVELINILRFLLYMFLSHFKHICMSGILPRINHRMFAKQQRDALVKF